LFFPQSFNPHNFVFNLTPLSSWQIRENKELYNHQTGSDSLSSRKTLIIKIERQKELKYSTVKWLQHILRVFFFLLFLSFFSEWWRFLSFHM
jgi:hypothetical protein